MLTLPFYFFQKKKTFLKKSEWSVVGGKFAAHAILGNLGPLRRPLVRLAGESTWFLFSDSIPRNWGSDCGEEGQRRCTIQSVISLVASHRQFSFVRSFVRTKLVPLGFMRVGLVDWALHKHIRQPTPLGLSLVAIEISISHHPTPTPEHQNPRCWGLDIVGAVCRSFVAETVGAILIGSEALLDSSSALLRMGISVIYQVVLDILERILRGLIYNSSQV